MIDTKIADALRILAKSPNPPKEYMKLARTYLGGTGCRLSSNEVYNLVCGDEAIRGVLLTAAEEVMDAEEEETT